MVRENEITRPGHLYYYDGVPAWTVRVAQPSRFKDVRMTLEFGSFLLPTGGLLACILRLYDIPDQPFYVHRVFDLGDETVAKYLRTSLASRHWIVEVRGGGEDRDVFRVAQLTPTDFQARCENILEHNRRLGRRIDGDAALRKFLATFEPAAKENGWEAGWEAVREEHGLSA
ncbi:MAG: hypothetical protein ABIJ96_11235 [Elusimicrobiota bacterium]